jgi:hypothetical protein
MKKIVKLTESDLMRVVQRVINEGLSDKKFLIIYQITNFKAETDFSYEKIDRLLTKNISEWKSPIYTYIQKSRTEDEARELFEDKWDKLANYEPKPKLEILSVKEIEGDSDKIHTY